MKVIAGNVTAKFIDLTDTDRRKLDQSFAVVDQRLFFIPQTKRLILAGRIDGKTHFFDKKTDTIATGLLPKALTIFPDLEIQREISQDKWQSWQTSRIRAQTVEVNDITLRPDQRGAVVSAVDNMRGILEMATNSGKTPIGSAIIKAIQVPTLWVIHRKALLDETSQRVQDYLGMPVGKIGAGYKKTGSLVTVGIDKSIMSMGEEWLKQFECVIFDESQHLSCKTQQDIAKGCINAHYRIAMSGSFPKDKNKKFQIMAAADATLLYQLTNTELISAGLSAKPKVYIRPLRYPAQVYGMPLYGFEWDQAYDYCIYKNEQYHHWLVRDIEKWIDQDKTVLLFAERLEMANSICQKLNDKHIKYGLVTGDTPDFNRRQILKKFGRKEIPIVISTTVLDEGVDVPSLGCVILASGGKSSIRILQRVGRALRRKKEGENIAMVQDYNQIGNKYTERHSKARHKVYSDQGFDITMEQETQIA